MSSHDIKDLLEKVGVLSSIDDDFHALLDRLSHVAIWEGRYPTPTSPDKFDTVIPNDENQYVCISVFGSSDLINLSNLWTFLENELSTFIESSKA